MKESKSTICGSSSSLFLSSSSVVKDCEILLELTDELDLLNDLSLEVLIIGSVFIESFSVVDEVAGAGDGEGDADADEDKDAFLSIGESVGKNEFDTPPVILFSLMAN
ncbi:unnamed protein product [[Candida] boidinii]|nr:unnamed protein product [[Candida] boidinii]